MTKMRAQTRTREGDRKEEQSSESKKPKPRFFIEPDPESNAIIASVLADAQTADTSAFQRLPCADGHEHSVWEVTEKQVQNLGVLRQVQDLKFGFTVWRLWPDSSRAMFYEEYQRRV